jgi:hypothetical protein
VAGADDEIVRAVGTDGIEDAFDPRHYTEHTSKILKDAGIT